MSANKRGNWLIGMGLLLVAAALCLTVYNLWEDQRAGETSADALAQLRQELAVQPTRPTVTEPPVTQTDPSQPDSTETQPTETEPEIVIPDYIRDPNMEMPTMEIDGRQYLGILEIPVLELSLPILSEWSYSALKVSPCRYKGSAYLNNLILMAHNYRRHFGRLLELQPGDRVIFTDAEGNVFHYAVMEMETLAIHAVEEMESGQWDLTLFTCTLGGKTRVTIRCQRT